MCIGSYLPYFTNPIYMFLSFVSRPSFVFGVVDMLGHVMTCIYLVLICTHISSVSFNATLLTSLVVLLLYGVINHPGSSPSLCNGDMVEYLKVNWSIFASTRQLKRRRARLRRRFRKRSGLKSGRKKFRRLKLAYHLVLKCRRRIGNKPTDYKYRHEIYQYGQFLRQQIPQIPHMYHRLKKLKPKLKRARRPLDDAVYHSFIVDGVEEFNGYLSPHSVVLDDEGQVRISRFCYTEDVSPSTINEFCSSFDPIESYKVMKLVEEQRLTLESIGTGSDINDLDFEDHKHIAKQTIMRAHIRPAQKKSYPGEFFSFKFINKKKSPG